MRHQQVNKFMSYHSFVSISRRMFFHGSMNCWKNANPKIISFQPSVWQHFFLSHIEKMLVKIIRFELFGTYPRPLLRSPHSALLSYKIYPSFSSFLGFWTIIAVIWYSMKWYAFCYILNATATSYNTSSGILSSFRHSKNNTSKALERLGRSGIYVTVATRPMTLVTRPWTKMAAFLLGFSIFQQGTENQGWC